MRLRFLVLPSALVSAALALMLLAGLGAPLRAQVPPDEHWVTLTTEHFRVHYPRGMDELGRRAAGRAERAWAQLAAGLVAPPRHRIDLVVADNQDASNGYATPLPTNRIVVFAHPPVDEPLLSFYDDWMQLVISHELTHVFHLDYARGPFQLARNVLGRNVIGFPNLFTPGWMKEGLAVYEESRLTRAGRLRGSLHEMEIRTAVLEDRFFSIDRASGNPASWPGGYATYTYGSEFMQWLGARYGDAKVREFVRIVGRRIVPYRLDAAAQAAFGTPFSDAWGAWAADLRGRYAALADSLRREGLTEPEVLTPEGRYASFPRFSPDGARIAYAASTGREESQTRIVSPGGRERVLAPRTTLAPAAWLPGGGLVTSQIDARDPYRDLSDLYLVRANGSVHRMTHGARIEQPDARGDGRIVAIQGGGGTTWPVLVDARTGAARPLVERSLDVQWTLPRWSPDGARIAAARWRRGGFYDVVVMDTTGAVVREVTHDRAVDAAPAWSPDGRWIVFSSDRTGINDLYAYDLSADRLLRVTRVTTGAFEPDVSRDGRWIAFSYYRADGYHVARVPFDPSRWTPAPPVRAEVRDSAAVPDEPVTASAPRPYSPWRSLAPASVSPVFYRESVLGTGIGAGVAGQDVVGRHSYGAYALIRPASGRTDASVAYVYGGLVNPALGLSLQQSWGVLYDAGTVPRKDGSRVGSALLERERAAAGTLTFRRPRYRSYAWLSAGAGVRSLVRAWDDPTAPGVDELTLTDVPTDLGAVASAGYSTVRSFAFSISPEQGWLAALSAQGRRFTRPFGHDSSAAGYLRLTGRGQAYHPFDFSGFARHVVALRAAAGADVGSRSPGLKVGGTGGVSVAGPLGSSLGLGESLQFPVRGYRTGTQRGDRAFSASAEYRVPLADVERGYRLFPAYLDRLWGAAFTDAGAAWCVDACDPTLPGNEHAARPLLSLGAELGADVTFFYSAPLTLRAGLAAPLSTVVGADGTRRSRPGPVVYLRLGRSF
ncbi:MAG: WD40-like beta Propeller containing protein [Gemmatimonadetes bacterium]|nr:WD40-like beta Propeller containing protein [Gemmatimonadota bacterium]